MRRVRGEESEVEERGEGLCRQLDALDILKNIFF